MSETTDQQDNEVADKDDRDEAQLASANAQFSCIVLGKLLDENNFNEFFIQLDVQRDFPETDELSSLINRAYGNGITCM